MPYFNQPIGVSPKPLGAAVITQGSAYCVGFSDSRDTVVSRLAAWPIPVASCACTPTQIGVNVGKAALAEACWKQHGEVDIEGRTPEGRAVRSFEIEQPSHTIWTGDEMNMSDR
jgi:hypothetical protein